MLKRLLILSTVVLLAQRPLQGVELKQDGWKFPNPARAAKKAIRPLDTVDRIAGKETLVKVYQKGEDTLFEIFEIEGEVFACQFQIKGKEGEPPTSYAIVDTDGDGVFESKFGPGERARTPEWVIQRYFKRHPELKDPGTSSAPSPTN